MIHNIQINKQKFINNILNLMVNMLLMINILQFMVHITNGVVIIKKNVYNKIILLKKI